MREGGQSGRDTAEVLAEVARAEGVATCFALLGDAHMAWATRLMLLGARLITVRHEHCAVAMAWALADRLQAGERGRSGDRRPRLLRGQEGQGRLHRAHGPDGRDRRGVVLREQTKVSTGGVRVTSKVIERPVEETVTLREEHIETERRSADRPLDADEANADLKEKTIEVMGTRDEVEVRKEARVTGEVVVHKDVNERVETVHDTVPSTDVKVEEVAGSSNRK